MSQIVVGEHHASGLAVEETGRTCYEFLRPRKEKAGPREGRRRDGHHKVIRGDGRHRGAAPARRRL